MVGSMGVILPFLTKGRILEVLTTQPSTDIFFVKGTFEWISKWILLGEIEVIVEMVLEMG